MGSIQDAAVVIIRKGKNAGEKKCNKEELAQSVDQTGTVSDLCGAVSKLVTEAESPDVSRKMGSICAILRGALKSPNWNNITGTYFPSVHMCSLQIETVTRIEKIVILFAPHYGARCR